MSDEKTQNSTTELDEEHIPDNSRHSTEEPAEGAVNPGEEQTGNEGQSTNLPATG